jgi:predicted peroxiredoxin
LHRDSGQADVQGLAEKLQIKSGDPKTVYDWIREAHDHGARFWACPANLELFDKSESDLIPECKGFMGAAAMIQDIMDGKCKVLTF